MQQTVSVLDMYIPLAVEFFCAIDALTTRRDAGVSDLCVMAQLSVVDDASAMTDVDRTAHVTHQLIRWKTSFH